MKPLDIEQNMYIEVDKENNKESPKFKVAEFKFSCKNIKI